MNRMVFGGIDYAPLADFSLLKTAVDKCEKHGIKPHIGNVFTSDSFYRDNAEEINGLLVRYNVLAVEMETRRSIRWRQNIAAKRCRSLRCPTMS